MPPMGWKWVITVFTTCFIYQVITADPIRDSISMTSNGWRPIIGMGKDEITQYRNPSPINGNSETIQAVPIHTTESPKNTTTPPTSTPSKTNHIIIHHGVKIPPHSKHHVLLLPTHHAHGPHIPLNSANLRPRGKIPHFTSGGKKLKPIRGLVASPSMKNEVFIPAPSGGGGSYSFFTQNHGPVKTRETPNLGPKNHYHISQPHGHIEFISGNFPLPHVPMHAFLVPNRSPVYITHNEDYTRNLIPPPPFKLPEIKEKRKERPKNPEPSPTSTNLQISLSKPKDSFIQDGNFIYPEKEQAIEVQVTREKFNHFHNNVPNNYNPTTDHYIEPEHFTVRQQLPRTELPVFNSFPKFSISPSNDKEETRKPVPTSSTPFEENTKRQSFIKFSDIPNYPTYDVTENKQWQPFYSTHAPTFHSPPRIERPQRLPEYDQPPKQNTRHQVEYYQQPPRFVKEPQHFDALEELAKEPFLPTPYQPETIPTLATQDVSTIYTEVQQKNRQKNEYETYSTYNPATFSIKEVSTHFPVVHFPPPTQFPTQEHVEVTTGREEAPPTEPTTERMRTRTNQRRRRPQTRTTSTTTESYASESYEETTRRRPSRYRSTHAPDESKEVRPTRGRSRIRTRPPPPPTAESEETPINHKSIEDQVSYSGVGDIQQTQPGASVETDESLPLNVDNEVTDSSIQQQMDEASYEISKSEEVVEVKKTTTELATTNLLTPENEIDYTTVAPVVEVVETTTPTTTTTEASTTKSNRIRGRPVKYDSKNRPRFSVKDYRQRLTTTTETSKPTESTTSTNRFRFPNKRKSTTTQVTLQDDVVTERAKIQKDTRFTTTESVEEKPKSTRRPYSRYRSTTEATTTQKVSVKPNIFTNLRRPTPISLRTRILNRNKTKYTTTEKTDITDVDLTELDDVNITTETLNKPQSIEVEGTPGDILKNEAFMHSQIVSDLTSSAKKEYDTPGLFKAVSPASRRVPGYFTISTDDPRLPIEAFFPNIDKKKQNDESEDDE